MPKPLKKSKKLFSFWRLGLKNKLIAIVMGVGTVPLVLAMFFSYQQGNKSLIQVIGASFQALAYETSTSIDQLVKEEISKITRLANHPTLVLSVQEQNRQWEKMSVAEMEERLKISLQAWKARDPQVPPPTSRRASFILSDLLRNDRHATENTVALFVTDNQGVLVASSNFHPEYVNRKRLSSQSLLPGRTEVFIGPLTLDYDLGNHIFEIAVPIHGNDGKVNGVLHRLYAAREFFASYIEPITFGDTGHVMLINSQGIVMTCPILPTGHQLKDPELVKAVTGAKPAWAITKGDGHGSLETSLIGYSPLVKTNRFVWKSNKLQWFTFAWQSSHELFAPTKSLLSWISVAGGFSVLLIAIMGALAAHRIVRPIRQLQHTAASIGRGEAVEPLEINTGDEIELLAEEINTMSRMIQKTFSGLEHQVETKTQEVIYQKKYTDGILMSVPETVVIFDSQLRIEYANAAFEKLTGCPASQYQKLTLTEAPLKFKDSWSLLAEDLSKYQKGIQKKNTGPIRKAASSPAKDPLAPGEVEPARDFGSTLTMGDHILAYQFFDVLLEKDKDRRIGLILKNVTDERKLMEQLTRADKLSGMGTLAAGVAHEMNNPLYSIIGYTEAMMEENQLPKIQSMAQKILDRARHMASIILNLTGYARDNKKDALKEVDITERLEAAADMALMSPYTNDIVLERNYEPVPAIQAKPEEIQQVFLNIISNAVQAMDGQGTIELSSLQNNGFIEIRIRDTGPGIPQEYLSKVFDPFFTTKEQGKGTGLGLNIVHQIVEKYGGSIEIETAQNQGTTFLIFLPVNGAGDKMLSPQPQG
ncbi:MAG: HAMP domain-containing protein [Nitrospinaceae bacterium]|nr:HAMP domain-containing protein [Nitrospinaceae bacterium]NIR54035.1 HAMP domain-containing protein [Nitrospinaceae bacterium]NIS84452.1 HAMP domain-containing protein [Nitrospinaceae bacterium]NIT81248.1 HAMP domain-containing protein [Nitrospinaceae bacterium]NIU43535.1 HAMP domain-containing protein [Nitrospinaceae bacterium]